jgi:tetratricopeptide (TPR) repeat protein
MRPLFDEQSPESVRNRRGRTVSRFALTAMFALFLRTLLWVLDGVFYTSPAEIRLYSVGVFLVGGFSLWQILDLKAFARRLFIGVAALTWGVAAVSLIRTYQIPVTDFTPIQTAEYLAFAVWTAVSVLFVVYLCQPAIRDLFTASQSNPYQRALYVIALGHVLFFEWQGSQSLVNVVVKLAPSEPAQALSLGRFQEECSKEERSRLPQSAGEETIANYCRCDSQLLAERCPPGLAAREQCLSHIEGRIGRSPRAKIGFFEAREACVSQYFPKAEHAVHAKSRAQLERNVLQRLTVALPLEHMVPAELAQRKFLLCMSLGLFSRCRDARPSASYSCLTKPIEAKETSALKTRCERLALAKQGEYEALAKEGEARLAEGKYTEAVAAAEKLISLAGDRPEGYLLRGLAYVQVAEHKTAVDDLTIALNVSDFGHTRVRALEGRRLAHLNLKNQAAADADAAEACSLGASFLCPENGAKEPVAWRGSEEVAATLAKAISAEALGNKLAWSVKGTPPKQDVPGSEAAALETARVPTAEATPAPAPEPKRVPDAAPAATPSPAPEASATNEVAAPPASVATAAPAAVTEEKRAAWNELTQVGEVAFKMGDSSKAREKFLAALSLSEELAPGNELCIESSLKLAAFLRDPASLAEGESYLRKTFPFWAALSERHQRSIVEEVGRYSTLYQNRRDWQLQERLLLEIWKEASATESLLVREINLHLSSLYQASGRAEKLETFFKRETEIYEKRFGKKDVRVESSRQQLSNFYLSQGETAKASAALASPVALPQGR